MSSASQNTSIKAHHGSVTSSSPTHRNTSKDGQSRPSGSYPLTQANLATHQQATANVQGKKPIDRWLLDRDDRLVRQRVANYWEELLTHDDVAKAIEEIVKDQDSQK